MEASQFTECDGNVFQHPDLLENIETTNCFFSSCYAIIVNSVNILVSLNSISMTMVVCSHKMSRAYCYYLSGRHVIFSQFLTSFENLIRV